MGTNLLDWVSERAPTLIDEFRAQESDLPRYSVKEAGFDDSHYEFAFELYHADNPSNMNSKGSLGLKMVGRAAGVIAEDVFIFDDAGNLVVHNGYINRETDPLNLRGKIQDEKFHRLTAHSSFLHNWTGPLAMSGTIPEWIAEHPAMYWFRAR